MKLLRKLLLQNYGICMLHVETFVDKLTVQCNYRPKLSSSRITLPTQLVVEFFDTKHENTQGLQQYRFASVSKPDSAKAAREDK